MLSSIRMKITNFYVRAFRIAIITRKRVTITRTIRLDFIAQLANKKKSTWESCADSRETDKKNVWEDLLCNQITVLVQKVRQ